MSTVGMDIQAVRTLAKLLAAKADEIESIANSLSSKLHSVDWKGHDADQFRDAWNSGHRSQLMHVASSLRDTSNVANRNASDQEQVSSR